MGATARTATMPWLGWSAFLNEVFDAASVLSEPPVRERTITSPAFTSPELADHEPGVTRALRVTGEPLVNGFGEPLHAAGIKVSPAVLAGSETAFHLVAEQVRPECVGVYRGTVRVRPVEEGDDRRPGGAAPDDSETGGAEWQVDVWLVVS